MANRISDKMVKAFERFNADLETFRKETEGEDTTLYEDAFSYQALRNIARQRWNHRLPEWHVFVDWIKTLPFSQELILDGLNIGEDGKWVDKEDYMEIGTKED